MLGTTDHGGVRKMRVKKAIKKIAALGTGVVMMGTSLLSAAAQQSYTLADYPMPFVQNGVFAGVMIIGDQAAAQDVIGVTDIAISLQQASSVAAGSSSGTGSVVTTGDVYQVKDSSGRVEFGESLYDAVNIITSSELKALESGVLTNSEGSFPYKQYLRWNSNGTVAYVDNVIDDDDDADIPADYLYFANGKQVYEYELQFAEPLESDIVSAKLDDLDNEPIKLLGRDWTITKADRAGVHQVKLTLFAGDIDDTLEEGASKTYTLGGIDYDVTVLIIDDNAKTVKFSINGYVTKSLKEDETDKTPDGLELGVREVLANEAGDVTQDLVEFFLGADKLIIQDTNITDASTGGSLEVNSENIEDMTVIVSGTDDSTKTKLSSLRLNLTADDDFYIGEDKCLQDQLAEPEGVFGGNWDICFHGMRPVEMETVKVSSAGDDQYKLTFTNRDGDEASFELYSVLSNNTLRVGDNTGERDLKLFEGNITSGGSGDGANNQIQKNDEFILSDASGNVEDAFTHVMRYKGNDESNNIMSFEDRNTGETVEVSYDSANASAYTTNTAKDATIKVGGKEFNVDIISDTKDANIIVDFNGNGQINNADAPPAIVTKGRMFMNITNLTQTTAAGTGAVTGGFGHLFMTWDRDLIDDATGDEVINLTFKSASTTQLDLIAPAYVSDGVPTVSSGHKGYYPSITAANKFSMRTIGSLDEKEERNIYGALFHLNQDTSGPDSLTVTNPLTQAEPIVTIEVAGSTVGTSDGAGGETVVLNRIEVGAAKLASEVSDLWGQHSIVVGGPCANSAAAELLGNPADCTKGFEPGVGFVRLFSDNGKYAMLVAGYSAADTRRATTVVANYKDYALSGTNLEVKAGINNQINVAEAPVLAMEEETPEVPAATEPAATTV